MSKASIALDQQQSKNVDSKTAIYNVIRDLSAASRTFSVRYLFFNLIIIIILLSKTFSI